MGNKAKVLSKETKKDSTLKRDVWGNNNVEHNPKNNEEKTRNKNDDVVLNTETMIPNNEKGCKKIVPSGKIFESETIKDTKSITFRQTILRKSDIEAKTLNALETWAVEKENTISCLVNTIQTSKTDSTKQLIEQREGNYGLRVTLKTDIDSSTKRKIDTKENQNEVTRMQESEVTSKSIEEGKERMRPRLTEDTIGNKTSQEKHGKQVILQRNENNESSSVLGNNAKVLSNVKQNDITRLNETRVLSEQILEKVNTKFQHKQKPKETNLNDNITYNIVENSNDSDDNGAAIRNEVKGGKKIVASGNINDKEDVKETNDIPLKQNTLRTAIIVEALKVSVNNAGDYIVMNVLHDTNNKLTLEREEENEETDDIKTSKQESPSILTTSIVNRAPNVSVNNTEDYIVKNFLQAMNNNHKIERIEENNETEDINNINQESSSKSNNKKEKIGANTFEEDLRQRLEKEKHDAKDLCEKHDSYEVKWDGEYDTEEDRMKCKEQCRESFVFRNEEDVRQRLEKKKMMQMIFANSMIAMR